MPAFGLEAPGFTHGESSPCSMYFVMNRRRQTNARAVGAHEPSLRRLLRFLSTLGALEEDGNGRFAATPLGKLLRSDHLASGRPWAILYGSSAIWRTYGELYESVMSGQPAFERVHGAPFFEYLERNQEDASAFNAAMTSGGSPSAILDAYDLSSFEGVS
jgi:hypothetical protein